MAVVVVSYRNSTSNHNTPDYLNYQGPLYLIEILHQTTTCGRCEDCLRRCILSKFYIKPQRRRTLLIKPLRCILSKFYIKPQQRCRFDGRCFGCILSKFYIKPQLEDTPAYISRVVSYRNSTSNHNVGPHID